MQNYSAMKISSFFLLLFFFYSCNQSTDISNASDTNKSAISMDIENGKKQVDRPDISENPKIKFSNNISILNETSYAELDTNTLAKKWHALRKDNLYLLWEECSLNLSPEHNPMLDKEGEKTAINVTCDCDEDHETGPMLLIGGIKIPKEHRIPSFISKQKILYPGESELLGDYLIAASGNTKNGQISKYKLTIAGKKNGKDLKQTFLEQDGFDGNMITFYWAGDLDGDEIPDFYMETSHKYSFSERSLFLSSQASENEIIKLVAQKTKYAC